MSRISPHKLIFAWLQRWPAMDAATVLPVLTVVLLLLNAPDVWYLRIPLVVTGIFGLVVPQAMRTPAYWYVQATLLGATVYFNWDTADNHHYLFVYWCLALCGSLSLPSVDQAAALARASRWLLALCMILAAAWKLATPGYIDGAFFEFTLIADPRFSDVARAFGGASTIGLADNRELTTLLTEGHLRNLDVNAVQLIAVPRTEQFAQILTWWTVLIEAALGLLFLLPEGRKVSRIRNSALLLFAVTTYSVAHVRGFGWMLMLLGLAQCRPEQKALRWSYLGALLLIQLYLLPVIPLLELILDAIGLDAGCGCT